MTNLKKYKLYLGIEFLMTEKGIFMSQWDYAARILDQFHM